MTKPNLNFNLLNPNTSRTLLGPRLGKLNLSLTSNLKEISLETPNLLMVSKGGNHIRHLTMDQLPHLNIKDEEGLILQTSLDQYFGFKYFSNDEFGKDLGLRDVTNTKEYGLVMDLHNPSMDYTFDKPCNMPFKSGKQHATIRTNMGLQKVSAYEYMNQLNQLKPDLAVMLYDRLPEPDLRNHFEQINGKQFETSLEDSSEEIGHKRHLKAIDRTYLWLDQLVDFNPIKFKHPPLTFPMNQIPLIGPLLGGNFTDLRHKCVEMALKYNNLFKGYLITNVVGESDKIDQLSQTLSKLFDNDEKIDVNDKFIMARDFNTPGEVLDAIALGVDLIDTAYPTLASDQGYALTFSLSPNASPASAYLDLNPTHTANPNPLATTLTPISTNCPCFSCQSDYSLAYIAHLITTHEMLAHILLTHHNLIHYQLFLKEIRLAIKENRFEEFKSWFQQTYKSELWRGVYKQVDVMKDQVEMPL